MLIAKIYQIFIDNSCNSFTIPSIIFLSILWSIIGNGQLYSQSTLLLETLWCLYDSKLNWSAATFIPAISVDLPPLLLESFNDELRWLPFCYYPNGYKYPLFHDSVPPHLIHDHNDVICIDNLIYILRKRVANLHTWARCRYRWGKISDARGILKPSEEVKNFQTFKSIISNGL